MVREDPTPHRDQGAVGGKEATPSGRKDVRETGRRDVDGTAHLTTDHMGDAHLIIVNHGCEMICWKKI